MRKSLAANALSTYSHGNARLPCPAPPLSSVQRDHLQAFAARKETGVLCSAGAFAVVAVS